MKGLFLRMKLKNKMIFLILTITTVIFFIVIGYLANRNRSVEISNAKDLAESMSKNYANTFSEYLNYSMDISRSLAHNSKALIEAGEPRRLVLDKMLEQTIKENPEFLAVWTRWEPDAFDGQDTAYVASDWGTLSGIFDLNYYYVNGEIIRYVDMTTTPEEEAAMEYGPYITIPMETMQEALIEPYYYSYTGRPEDEILMTTASVPVIIDGDYRGVIAIDIELESFYEIIRDIEFYESGFGKIISTEGSLVTHPRLHFVGEPSYEFIEEDIDVMQAIHNGNSLFSIEHSHDLGEEALRIYTPIQVGNAPTPWAFALEVPISEIEAAANQRLWVAIFLGIIALAVLFIVIWLISRYITTPVLKTTNVLKTLSKGDLEKVEPLKTRKEEDELTQMANATNTLIEGLKNTVLFARNIEQGKLDSEFTLLSDNDQLGQALVSMRESLIAANKEELKRKEEDRKRRWSTEGFAKFGEILRYDNEDIETLSYKVIKNLVEYLEACQGGVFIINDENDTDKFLEMTACYAYDRRKYLEKKIKIGEGLVGTCYLEGKTNYMTEIPESYVKIASGLGEEKPTSLILVPLKLNEEVYGVIELASLNKFEDYQIEFLEKIGENIASTISSLRINMRTATLLEKSQQQAEEMKAQEEEMRQNMEELSATQEEMARKTSEMESILNALDASSFVLEYDINGYVQKISKSYLNFLGISEDEAVGKHHADKIEFTEEQKKEYDQFWKDLKNGKIKKQETELNIDGRKLFVAETYAPVFDQNGNAYKFFKIANNITKSKMDILKAQEEKEKLEKELKKCQEEKENLTKQVSQKKK